MFNIFKKEATPVTQITIQFPIDFESTSVVSVCEKGTFPKSYENWIWDLYYAKMLYSLGENAISDGLKEQLENWADHWVGPLLSGLPLPQEALILDYDLKLVGDTLIGEPEEYRIDIIESNDGWPTIQTYLPKNGFQNRAAYSVLAFAQYLIDMDKNYFARELPIHLIAMKRFYTDTKPFTSIRSVLEAPTYAVNSALKTIKKLNEE
jgi:hypothetical protein